MLRLVQREPEARARELVQERFRRSPGFQRDVRCKWVIETVRHPVRLVRAPGLRMVGHDRFELQCHAPMPALRDATQIDCDRSLFNGSRAWFIGSPVDHIGREWRTEFGTYRNRRDAVARLLLEHFETTQATAADWAEHGIRVVSNRYWLGWCAFAACLAPGPERCDWCDLLYLVRRRRRKRLRYHR